MDSNPEQNKQSAVDFLQMIVAGKIDEAYQKYADMEGRHHNIFTKADFTELKQGMKDNDAKFPNKKLEVQHVIGDGDLVAVHSRLTLNPPTELIAVHLLRFGNGKITELWDCAQPVPKDLINKDGAF